MAFNHRVSEIIDAEGHRVQLRDDADDNLTMMSAIASSPSPIPLNGSTTYTYNDASNLLSLTDELNRTTTLTNSLGDTVVAPTYSLLQKEGRSGSYG